MAQPTFAQYRALGTNTAGVVPETLLERWLTCLAVLMSGQNPDGSSLAYPHP